jgi:hypothetical protein
MPRRGDRVPDPFPAVSSELVLALYRADYPTGQNKGYVSWNPDKRTAKIRSDIEDVLVRYGEHWHLGPRQVGYVLIGGYGYIKSDAHFRKVLYNLERGRRAELEVVLSDGTAGSWWDAVADGKTPDPLTPYSFDSPEDFIENVRRWAEEYSCDLQAGQRVFVEIWVETASLAPQVARIAHEYGVPVYSSSGESALEARRNIALRAAQRAQYGIKTLVLQIGDFDAKGVEIFRVMEADALAFAAAHGADGMVACQRLAVTVEQVEQNQLDRDPVKMPKGDKQPPGPPLPFNTQAEALNPEQLAEVVRAGIERYTDRRVRATARTRSNVERATVIRALDGVKLQRRLRTR